MFLNPKHLGHGISFSTSKQINPNVRQYIKIVPSNTETEPSRFTDSMICYSKVFDELQIKMKPMYNLHHDNIKFHRKTDMKTLFQQTRTSITQGFTLTLHDTKHPFFNSPDNSLIGIGCVLFQTNDKGKLDVVSYISRVVTTNEKTLH